MISEETARKRAVKFFKEHRLPKLAQFIQDGACVDEVFPDAIRTLGKRKARELWAYVPQQLRTFVFCVLRGDNNCRLEAKLDKLYNEFYRVLDSYRPERVKGFSECMKKASKIVETYLERR